MSRASNWGGAALFSLGLVCGSLLPGTATTAQTGRNDIDWTLLSADPRFASAVSNVMESRIYKSQGFRFAVEATARSSTQSRASTTDLQQELRYAISRCRVNGDQIRC